MKALSDGYSFELEQDKKHRPVHPDAAVQQKRRHSSSTVSNVMLPTAPTTASGFNVPLTGLTSNSTSEFVVELRRLMAAHGLTPRDVMDLLIGGALSTTPFSSGPIP